jgi:hypothetical protein
MDARFAFWRARAIESLPTLAMLSGLSNTNYCKRVCAGTPFPFLLAKVLINLTKRRLSKRQALHFFHSLRLSGFLVSVMN